MKNRKAKDLEDWQRKYQCEQAQNREGDKAEKECGCEAVEGRIYLTKRNTVCQSVFAKAHSVFVMRYGNNSRGKRNT